MATPRYLEDLAVGERKRTEALEVTEAESIAFALRYDPQPMHTGVALAKPGLLGGGLIVSGWYTAAIVMRLTVDAQPLGGTPLVGIGVDEMRWPKPVRPGDTIHAETEILSISPSRSKPDFGIARVKITAHNQRNEVVFTMNPALWVPRRPAT